MSTVEITQNGHASLSERHRDKNGEISRKHGNTLVRTLRRHYGPHFGKGCGEQEKLSQILRKLDEPSLTKLLRDHDAGKLPEVCRG